MRIRNIFNAIISIRNSNSFIGASKLSSGSIVAQLLTFVTTVVVARLFTPSEIGDFAATVAIAMAVYPVISLGLQVAIVPAETDEDAWSLANAAFTTIICGSIITGISVGAINYTSGSGTPEILLSALFVFILLVTLGLWSIFSQINLRFKEYGALARRGIIQNFVLGFVQIVGSYVLPAATSLYVGEAVGRIAGVASLTPRIMEFRKSIKFKVPLKKIVKKYQKTATKFLPASILDAGSAQLIVIFSTLWFGAEYAGYYAMVAKFFALPTLVVGTAVGQVLNSELSSKRLKGVEFTSPHRYKQVNCILSLIALFIGTFFFLLSGKILPFIYGSQWSNAGLLGSVIAFPMCVGIVWTANSFVFPAYLQFSKFLIRSSMQFALSIGVGTTLYLLGVNWLGVIFGISTAVAFSQIVGIWMAWRIVVQPNKIKKTY